MFFVVPCKINYTSKQCKMQEDKRLVPHHPWGTLLRRWALARSPNSPHMIWCYPRDNVTQRIHEPWLWLLITTSWRLPRADEHVIMYKKRVGNNLPKHWALRSTGASILSIISEWFVHWRVMQYLPSGTDTPFSMRSAIASVIYIPLLSKNSALIGKGSRVASHCTSYLAHSITSWNLWG